MSVIDELQTAVSSRRRAGRPVGRRHRPRQRGSAASSSADGRVLTNAHNLRGDEVTVTFADGRSDARHGRRRRRRRRPRRRSTSTRPAPRRSRGRDGTQLAVGDRRLRRRGEPGGGTAGDGRHRVRGRAGVPRPRRPADRRQRRAHGAARAGLVRRRRSLDAPGRLLGLNTNRIGEGFYLALPADAALRERVDALGRGESPKRPRLGVAVAPSHVARRLRRSVGLPERDGLLVRGVEDGSPAAAPGSARAT